MPTTPDGMPTTPGGISDVLQEACARTYGRARRGDAAADTSDIPIEEFLAIRKSAGLKIDARSAEVTWRYAQRWIRTGFMSCPKSTSRSGANILLGPRRAIFGCVLAIFRAKRVTRSGKPQARTRFSRRFADQHSPSPFEGQRDLTKPRSPGNKQCLASARRTLRRDGWGWIFTAGNRLARAVNIFGTIALVAPLGRLLHHDRAGYLRDMQSLAQQRRRWSRR